MESYPSNQYIYLAVFPLETLIEDSRIEMLCQGLVMDIITDLSRFRPFQIIAHDAMQHVLPDGQLDLPGLEATHLDYLVKGMVRYQAEEIQLNIQLVKVKDSRLVWAEKFKGRPDDLFRIEEDIVESIVVSLQHFVDYDLLMEVRNKALISLGAYECWLRGYQELKKSSLEADECARDCFRQAMEIDPHYARAYTGMSLSYFNEWSCQLWTRWDVSKNGAYEWARKALEIDEWDHVSNVIIGRVYLFNGEYEKAEHYLRKGLRINPNDAEMLILVAFGFVYLGYTDEALNLYERARRLNPTDVFMAHACGAFVHFERGSFDEAIAIGEQHEPGKGWVDFPAFLAAAYFQKGDMEEMQRCWQAYLKDFSKKINGGKPADTQTALQWMIDINPYRDETRLRPFWEYLGREHPESLEAQQPAAPPSSQNILTKEGDIWCFDFNGKKAHLPDMKGIQDLTRLLVHPHEPLHCTDLMGAVAVVPGEKVFDDKAKTEYRKHILKIQEEIDTAEKEMNTGRLATLQVEYDQLLDHLSHAIGKGGSTRTSGGTVEKCRTAVTWRIRSAIKKLEKAHPTLSKHLNVSVKTGMFCEYAPEREIEWLISKLS